MPGLHIGGKVVQVPGVNVISPDEEKWVYLGTDDAIPRKSIPQQAIIHKTIADDPEKVISGAGPAKRAGGAQDTAERWARDPKHSGAQLITGFDGTTACLEDIVKMCAWHGNEANHRSYGHEIKEVFGGGVYQASLDATVAVTEVCLFEIGIQRQVPHKYIPNKPLKRFEDGGSTLFGVFGHRDITTDRNYWDPGDVIFAMLRAKGYESFDFAARQDIDVWSRRQEWLASEGYYKGIIDGLPGQATRKALLALGYPGGIFTLWRTLAEQPPLPPGFLN